ncbi:MAG: heat shock protein Hsp20 [Capsulimonas sp.]|nr:heat shock protein Hsp20 [Capsulimonas sp.]
MALPTLRRGGSSVSVRPTTQSSGVSRIDPWNDLAVMDRIFDSFFRSPFSAIDRGAQGVAPSEPQIELYETAEELIAYLYAPGLADDSFDISASADTISIRGERKPLMESTEGVTSHTPWGGLAMASGTFSASYNLPAEIDTAKVQANYKDGVLRLRMPKSEAAKPKQVKVEVNRS